MSIGTTSASAAHVQAYQASAACAAGSNGPVAAPQATPGATSTTTSKAGASPTGDSASFSAQGLALLRAATDPTTSS